MSIEYIIQKRMREQHKKEIQRWEESIPPSLRGYDYDELMETNWEGKITPIAKSKIVNYVKSPTPFLLFHGGSGLGKTVMGVEIVKKLLATKKGETALYIDTPTFLHEISLGNGNALLGKVKSPDILLLDDVGAGSTELSSARKVGMWSLVNDRWNSGKLTILTTNLPLTSQITSGKREMGLQEWFGASAWDRVSHNLTEVVFKGTSMRRSSKRSRES